MNSIIGSQVVVQQESAIGEDTVLKHLFESFRSENLVPAVVLVPHPAESGHKNY